MRTAISQVIFTFKGGKPPWRGYTNTNTTTNTNKNANKNENANITSYTDANTNSNSNTNTNTFSLSKEQVPHLLILPPGASFCFQTVHLIHTSNSFNTY